MGRKIRAAKASLVAAFLAAGGAAAARTVSSPPSAQGATRAQVDPTAVEWGDQLISFMKLDGYPMYLKVDDFAALQNYYKPQLITDATELYNKDGTHVADVLELYKKANAGPLTGILIGLEQFYKYDKLKPLLDYLDTTPGAYDAYAKFQNFLTDLQVVSEDQKDGGAFGFFNKLTGIAGDPLEEATD